MMNGRRDEAGGNNVPCGFFLLFFFLQEIVRRESHDEVICQKLWKQMLRPGFPAGARLRSIFRIRDRSMRETGDKWA